MKICKNCGAKMADDINFCVVCGESTIQMTSYDSFDNLTIESADGDVQATLQQKPAKILKTNRSLIKYILLSIITFGIYGIIVMTGIGSDINAIAGRYDKKKTMNFCLVAFIFSWLTLGIVPLIWYHKLSNRIDDELYRRKVYYPFGASTFWGWSVLGSFIIIGPFVYIHKLFTAMNELSADYNARG